MSRKTRKKRTNKRADGFTRVMKVIQLIWVIIQILDKVWTWIKQCPFFEASEEVVKILLKRVLNI